MNDTSLGVGYALDESVLPFALQLELNVTDPELIRELAAHAEGKSHANLKPWVSCGG